MPTTVQPKIRHEEFCLPRPGQQEPRIEVGLAYQDDEKTGRSAPSHRVTRCLECGAAHYHPLNKET